MLKEIYFHQITKFPLNLLVVSFNDKLSILKILNIFIFQIGNVNVIRKLYIYEILKT